MTRSPSDALSLTLPARSKSRARRRRPRKPSFWEVWLLGWTIINIFWAVQDLLRGDTITGCYFAVAAGLWWRGYQRVRRGLPRPFDGLGIAWILGGGILLTILRVPG